MEQNNHKVLGFLRKGLELFKAGDSSEVSNSLTNKGLVRELTEHFKQYLNEESVGQRMIYPMAFNILMEKSDYERRKEAFPFVLPEVVASFYALIDDNKEKYPNYNPPALYWFFQFSPCEIGKVENQMVRKGHVTSIATLTTIDIFNNVSAESNLSFSVKLSDTNNARTNINQESIKDVDIIAEGKLFRYKFDASLNRDSSRIVNASNMAELDGIATLSYTYNGMNYRYQMIDSLINISGKNEKRKGSAFFVLESPNIKDSHVQIRYKDGEFQIAVWGLTKLNGRALGESNADNVKWHALANNSSIFINDEISLKFEKK